MFFFFFFFHTNFFFFPLYFDEADGQTKKNLLNNLDTYRKMTLIAPSSKIQLSEKEYVLEISPLSYDLGLCVSLSDKSLNVLTNDLSKSVLCLPEVDKTGVTGLKSISGSSVVSCGSEGIKLWDLRSSSLVPQAHFISPIPNQGILSIDVSPNTNRIAVGSELVGPDAGVFLWDLRQGKEPVVSYVDSHNDDVTSVRFHPHDNNALLSGSTDGLINIYNTTIKDEDEAVYQTINHGSSIHSTGFLSEKRVYSLSHMETFSIYQVAHPNELVEEPKPIDFGDIREAWGCEYVVDIIPGYIACGSHSTSKLKLIPFSEEIANLDKSIYLTNGHGEEIVRSLYFSDSSNILYSCGEDGSVASWAVTLDTDSSYFSWPKWNNNGLERGTSKLPLKQSKHDKLKEKQKDKKKKKERFKPY